MSYSRSLRELSDELASVEEELGNARDNLGDAIGKQAGSDEQVEILHEVVDSLMLCLADMLNAKQELETYL